MVATVNNKLTTRQLSQNYNSVYRIVHQQKQCEISAVCVCVYVHMHVHACICAHTHTHTHTHKHTQIDKQKRKKEVNEQSDWKIRSSQKPHLHAAKQQKSV